MNIKNISLSQRFLLFLNILHRKSNEIYSLSKSSDVNKIAYISSSHAIKNIIDTIAKNINIQLQSIKDCDDDYHNFNNDIYNNLQELNLGDTSISKFITHNMYHLDHMNQKSKDIISNYIDIIIDGNINNVINDEYMHIKYNCYLDWLFIPIFLKWKMNLNENYQIIENFDKIMEKLDMKFYQINDYSTYSNYFNNVKNLKIFTEVINYLEKIKKDYEKIDEILIKFKNKIWIEN